MKNSVQNNRHKTLSRIIGILVLITSALHWKIFTMISTLGLANPGGLLALALLALSMISSAGLILMRVWGLVAFYPLALLATLFFSISLIPFVPLLFPAGMLPWVVVVINSSLMLVVMLIHREQARYT